MTKGDITLPKGALLDLSVGADMRLDPGPENGNLRIYSQGFLAGEYKDGVWYIRVGTQMVRLEDVKAAVDDIWASLDRLRQEFEG